MATLTRLGLHYLLSHLGMNAPGDKFTSCHRRTTISMYVEVIIKR